MTEENSNLTDRFADWCRDNLSVEVRYALARVLVRLSLIYDIPKHVLIRAVEGVEETILMHRDLLDVIKANAIEEMLREDLKDPEEKENE